MWIGIPLACLALVNLAGLGAGEAWAGVQIALVSVLAHGLTLYDLGKRLPPATSTLPTIGMLHASFIVFEISF